MLYSWTWWASSSADVVLYVLLTARVLLTGWTPCPTDDLPDQACPVYELSAWVQVGETPGLTMIDMLPVPPAGSVSLLSVEAQDLAGNRSNGEN